MIGVMAYVQATLRSGKTVRTCWVRDIIQKGNEITLKNSEEPGRRWSVTFIGARVEDLGEVNRGWNNNI
jgi:hypothetical protein